MQSPGAHGATLHANPGNYRDMLKELRPGDTLRLSPGSYKRLSIKDLHGTPDDWITISGPVDGTALILPEDCCNTVQIRRSSYLRIRGLVVDSQGMAGLDGINVKDGASHDLVIEGNLIRGVGGSQQTVGISTKAMVWNLQVRGNVILEPGTGMYFGNNAGDAPFIGGLIEHNLVLNAEGYAMQIKHQNPYSNEDISSPQTTAVRHNVFIKDDRISGDGNRPNLLLGGFPTHGQGAADLYQVYGNFISHNKREALIQATGRVAIHHNLLVGMGEGRSAIYLTDHKGPLQLAYVYHNTIVGPGRGIRFAHQAREDDLVFANAIFAAEGIVGKVSRVTTNLHRREADARQFLVKPFAPSGEMNFKPKDSLQLQLTKETPLPEEIRGLLDTTKDFDGGSTEHQRFLGAYVPGLPEWIPGATVKHLVNQNIPMEFPFALQDWLFPEKSR